MGQLLTPFIIYLHLGGAYKTIFSAVYLKNVDFSMFQQNPPLGVHLVSYSSPWLQLLAAC